LDAVRGFDRAVYVVAVGQLVNVFGSGLVYPFATVHFHFQVGITLAIVGLGLGVKSATTAVGTAVGGFLADRIGRKPVMVGSMATTAVTLAAFAFVPALAGFVPERVIQLTGVSAAGIAFVGVAAASGLTAGLYAPAGQAMTADLTAGDRRDNAYALLKVANNVGFGMGFVVGGVLYSITSVAVFIADGATSAVVAVVLLLFVPRVAAGENGDVDSSEEPSKSSADSSDSGLRPALSAWWRAATKPRVLTLAAVNVGFAVMYAQMQTTVPVIAKDGLGLTAAQLGTLYVLNPLTLVVLQLPLVDAVGEWRRTRGLIVSAGLWAASMVAAFGADLGVGSLFGTESLFGISPTVLGTVPLLGLLLVGGHLVLRTLGEILHSPLASALMSDLGSERERGTQLSLLEVAKRVGMGLGSFVGGLFFDLGLSLYLWPTLIVVCALVCLGLLALERQLSDAENGVGRDATVAGAD
jgi:MFS family permease